MKSIETIVVAATILTGLAVYLLVKKEKEKTRNEPYLQFKKNRHLTPVFHKIQKFH